MSRLIAACLLATLLLGAQAAVRTRPLYQPEPIPIPCVLSDDQMRSAIRRALAGRGWTPTEKGNGEIRARYTRREQSAVIAIRYGGEQARIDYVASEEMGYVMKHGKPEIAERYNDWVRNIEKDLAIQLSRACGA
jgi:hypothetical protein